LIDNCGEEGTVHQRLRAERVPHRPDCTALLERLGGLQEEVKLAEMDLQPLSEERLNRRTRLIEKADYTDAMFDLARQFRQADETVIAAPYWDLSFPAILKLYLENIYVTGLVSEYTETGRPHGLCLAGKLWYVTTAGGSYLPDFSYQYLHTLAAEYFGIPETELICAEMLDVEGFDADNLVAQQIGQIQKRKLL
jgi:FMN-dependent NADH-azoreductase